MSFDTALPRMRITSDSPLLNCICVGLELAMVNDWRNAIRAGNILKSRLNEVLLIQRGANILLASVQERLTPNR